jgi:hypothetical protein
MLATKKIRDGVFRNHAVTGVMILKPDAGVWKIYNQEVEDVQYF